MSSTIEEIPPVGTKMSLTEFRKLNLPEDSDLYLLEGVLRSSESSPEDIAVTRRNRRHCLLTTRFARFLDQWVDDSGFDGAVLTGEVGCDLNPENAVGIDVAVFAADVLEKNSEPAFIAGVPLVAVEILSPNDRQQDINDKIRVYLESGVDLTWIAQPEQKTVTAWSPGKEPQMFSASQTLTAPGVLPGFQIEIRQLMPDIR